MLMKLNEDLASIYKYLWVNSCTINLNTFKYIICQKWFSTYNRIESKMGLK
jgi:hypothetical protein